MQRHTLLQYIQRRQQFTRRMLPRQSAINLGEMNHAPTQPLYFAPPVSYPVAETNFLPSQIPTYAIQEINETYETQSLPIIDTSHLPNQSEEANFSSSQLPADKANETYETLIQSNHERDESAPTPSTNDSVGTDVSRPQPAHGHDEPVPTPSSKEPVETDVSRPPSVATEAHDSVGTDVSRPRPRRARIEERPSHVSQPTVNTPDGPTSSRTQPTQQTQMAQRKTKAQQPTPQDNKTSRAQAEADALFTSAPARSPQEWLTMLTRTEKKDAPPSSQQKEQNTHPMHNESVYSRGGSSEDVGGGPLRSPVPSQSQNVGKESLRSPVLPQSHNAENEPLRSPFIPPSQNAGNKPLPSPFILPSQNAENEPLRSPVLPEDNIFANNVRTDVSRPHIGVDPVWEERAHGRDQAVPTDAFADEVGTASPRPQPINAPGEPLSQRAQQFLRPVVGIDPTSVRVHRDAQAAHFAAAYQAEAVTTGNDIMLAAGHAEDTPQTLALLAHEMTHVARQHQPRFVPPITNTQTGFNTSPIDNGQIDRVPARGTPTMINDEAPSHPVVGAILRGRPASLLETADEERLALQVEQQAFYYAQQQPQVQESPYRATSNQSGQPAAVMHNSAMPVARSSSTTTNWGGLPAPWEPLPNWLTTATPPEGENTGTAVTVAAPPVQSAQTQMAQVQFTAPMPSPAANGNGHVAMTGPSSTNSGVAGDVQRAGVERSINTAQQIGSVQQIAGVAPAPEPDLDDLARQVYAVLKRRLGVEHRRL